MKQFKLIYYVEVPVNYPDEESMDSAVYAFNEIIFGDSKESIKSFLLRKWKVINSEALIEVVSIEEVEVNPNDLIVIE